MTLVQVWILEFWQNECRGRGRSDVSVIDVEERVRVCAGRARDAMTRSRYSFRQPGMPLKSLPLPESFRAEVVSKVKRQCEWRDLGKEGQREVWQGLGGVPRRTRRPAQTYTCSLCLEPGKSKSASCPTCKHTSGLMHLRCLAKTLVYRGGSCPYCTQPLTEISGVKVPDRSILDLEIQFENELEEFCQDQGMECVVDESTFPSLKAKAETMGSCLFCKCSRLGEGEEVGDLRGKLDLPLKLGVCGRCRRALKRSFKTFFYPTILKDGSMSVRVGSF